MIKLITLKQAKKQKKMNNITKSSIDDIVYFTLEEKEEGWSKVEYYASIEKPLK